MMKTKGLINLIAILVGIAVGLAIYVTGFKIDIDTKWFSIKIPYEDTSHESDIP